MIISFQVIKKAIIFETFKLIVRKEIYNRYLAAFKCASE